MSPSFRIFTYSSTGTQLQDLLVEDPEEAPEFYAHQLLHAADVSCVKITALTDGATVLTRCDPGLDFDTVVDGKHGTLG